MTYEEAYQLATDFHNGQKDKAGGPYIDFLSAVANLLKEQGEPEEVQILALLQDTITDSTGKTADDLIRAGVPASLVAKIVLLTYRKDQSYIDKCSCKYMEQGMPAEEATYEAREKEFLQFIRTLKVDPIAVKAKKAILQLLQEDKYIKRNERRELKTKFRLKKYKNAIAELES